MSTIKKTARNSVSFFLPPDVSRWITRTVGPVFNAGKLKYPVLIISIPKSGTHLVRNMVLSIPGTRYKGFTGHSARQDTAEKQLAVLKKRLTNLRPGNVFTGHIPFSEGTLNWLRGQGIKPIYVYRDPRDHTISMVHDVMRRGAKHDFYAKFVKQGDIPEQILAAIDGIGEGRTNYQLSSTSHPNIRLFYEAFIEWKENNLVFPVRFEDLIGEQDHFGDRLFQVIHGLLAFLEVPSTPDLISRVANTGTDPSLSGAVFRRGRSGSWKQEYTQEHIDHFNAVAGELLSELGYSWE